MQVKSYVYLRWKGATVCRSNKQFEEVGRGWELLTGPMTACRSSCMVVMHCLPGLQPL